MTEYKFLRKVQEQRGSYFVVIPKFWLEAHGIRESDLVEVLCDSYDFLKIRALKTVEATKTRRHRGRSSPDDHPGTVNPPAPVSAPNATVPSGQAKESDYY